MRVSTNQRINGGLWTACKKEGRKEGSEGRKWRWLGGNNNAIEWDWYVTGRKRTKSQWALIGLSSLYLIKWNEMLRVARLLACTVARARWLGPNQWPVTSDYSLTFHTRPATLTPMWPMCLWSRHTNGTPAPSSFLILLFNLLRRRSTALSCPALPCCIIINQSASALSSCNQESWKTIV